MNNWPVYTIMALITGILILFSKNIFDSDHFVQESLPGNAKKKVTVFPLPSEVLSKRYFVVVEGRPAPVMAAALNIHCVNFDFSGSVTVTITSADSTYWKDGVEIRPYSKMIYPKVDRGTITFIISKPGQYSIERPNLTREHEDEVLFLFANPPEVNPPRSGDRNVIYRAAGLYEENIDLTSNETLYLEGGAVIMGSVDIWSSQNVKIMGRGYIIHDGNQDPDNDEGYFQKRDWHPITTYNSSNITIEGITTVTRSRTWSIQLNGTYDLKVDNIKTISGHISNFNGDGIDWFGGGRAIIANSFFRNTDDCIAIYPWNNSNVDDIKFKGCTFWPSAANIIRIGWDKMTVSSNNFVMEDCDVIRMQDRISWQAPWALISAIANGEKPDQSTTLTNWHFNNIRMDNCNALFGMAHKIGRMKNMIFSNIWLAAPTTMDSKFELSNSDSVIFEKLRIGNNLVTTAEEAGISSTVGDITNLLFFTNTTDGAPIAVINEPVIDNKRTVTFDASNSTGNIATYSWVFGDGQVGSGQTVAHKYDNEDVFRVFLLVTDIHGKKDMSYIETASALIAPSILGDEEFEPGLRFANFNGTWASIPDVAKMAPDEAGLCYDFDVKKSSYNNKCLMLTGYLDIPSDDIYTFYVTADDGARMLVDNRLVAATDHKYTPNDLHHDIYKIEAKGSKGVGLKAGKHPVTVIYYNTTGNSYLTIKYEAKSVSKQDIPAARLYRAKQ
jgi:hypothetical protein